MSILAIDPGTTRSAWVHYADRWVWDHGIDDNDAVLRRIRNNHWSWCPTLVIEKVASYGMPVGAEVFETVFWSGRFAEAHVSTGHDVERITRKAVVTHLCGSARGKDANVRQALLDLYGGKEAAVGVKARPGPLHGIRGDEWAALAVAVAWEGGAR